MKMRTSTREISMNIKRTEMLMRAVRQPDSHYAVKGSYVHIFMVSQVIRDGNVNNGNRYGDNDKYEGNQNVDESSEVAR